MAAPAPAALSTVRLSRRWLVGITGSRATSATTSAAARHSGLEIAGAGVLAVSFGRYRTVDIAGVSTPRITINGITITRVAIVPVRIARAGIEFLRTRLPWFRGIVHASAEIVIFGTRLFGRACFDGFFRASRRPTSTPGRGTRTLIGHSQFSSEQVPIHRIRPPGTLNPDGVSTSSFEREKFPIPTRGGEDLEKAKPSFVRRGRLTPPSAWETRP
jgi:hypothetical protein